MSPKTMLAAALEIAQKAVLLDSENNVKAALDAYAEACDLLSKVLDHNGMTGDRRKLVQIYETYTDRIRLLNALHPRLSNNSVASGQGRFDRSSGSSSRGLTLDLDPDRLSTTTGNAADAAVDDFIKNIEKELAAEALSSASRSIDGNTSFLSLAASPRETIRQRRSIAMQPRNATNYPGTENQSPLSEEVGAAGYAVAGPAAGPVSTKVERQERRQSSLLQHLSHGIRDHAADYRSTNKTSPSHDTQMRRPSLHVQDLFRARTNHSTKLEVDPTRELRQMSIVEHSPSSNSSSFPSSSLPSSTVPTFENTHSDFVAFSIPAGPDEGEVTPPSEPLSRPYWTMRLLANTFAATKNDDYGCFITKDLFVPRDIWHLKNIKIKGEEEKIQANQILIDELHRLGRVNREDTKSLLKCLTGFEKAMESAQNILSKKLGPDLISSTTIPIRDPSVTPAKKMSGKTFARFLKGSTTSGEKIDTMQPAQVSGFEGSHTLLQSTTAQLFEVAQLIGENSRQKLI